MPKFNLADRVHIDNCTSITATITRISIWGDPANPQTQYHVEYFHEGDLREYWFDEWRLTKIGSARDPRWVVDWAPACPDKPEQRPALRPDLRNVFREAEQRPVDFNDLARRAGSPFVKPEYGVDVGQTPDDLATAPGVMSPDNTPKKPGVVYKHNGRAYLPVDRDTLVDLVFTDGERKFDVRAGDHDWRYVDRYRIVPTRAK